MWYGWELAIDDSADQQRQPQLERTGGQRATFDAVQKSTACLALAFHATWFLKATSRAPQPEGPQRLVTSDFGSSFGVLSMGPRPSACVFGGLLFSSTLRGVCSLNATDADKQRTPAQFEDVQWI